MPLHRVKFLVKIGPMVSEEKILIEIALCFQVVVWRISLNSSLVLNRILQSFHHMKALYVPMMYLYFIFQFIKGYYLGSATHF